MRIVIGADHRGIKLCERVVMSLEKSGHHVTQIKLEDVTKAGTCDYPDVAFPVASHVSEGQAELGILICHTGIGMSIAANKVAGIRAALVHDEFSAEISRRHNDANVLCLPADYLGERAIDSIVHKWIDTPFDGGRHERRIKKIKAIEAGGVPADALTAVENEVA